MDTTLATTLGVSLVSVLLAVLGYFLHRIVQQLDTQGERLRHIELDMATIKARAQIGRAADAAR